MKNHYSFIDLFYALISLLLVIIICAIYFIDSSSLYISIFATLLAGVFIVKFFDVIPLFILFLFISLYPLESTKFFWDNINLSVFDSFQTKENINFILLINSLFVLSLGNVIPKSTSSVKFEMNFLSFKSEKLFYFLILICFTIIFFGIQGKSLLDGGKYGTFDKSPLHEYFILFFMLLLFIQPKKSIFNSVMKYLVFFIYNIKTLLYGGRIEVLQLVLMIFYFNYVLPGKVSLKFTYLGIIISMYFAVILNNFRTHPDLIFSDAFYSLIDPLSIFKATPGQKYLSSNQGDVLQSSARLLGVLESGLLSMHERMSSFYYFIISSIMPSSLMPDYVNLSTYKQDIYASGGGAIIAIYFFIWLGYLGPVLAGFFIGFCIHKFYFSQNIILKIYGFVLLYTFPRWFAYTPIFLVKFAFYSIVIFGMFFFIHKIFIVKD